MLKPTSVEEAQEALKNFEQWFASFEKAQKRKLGKQAKKALRGHLEMVVAEGPLLRRAIPSPARGPEAAPPERPKRERPAPRPKARQQPDESVDAEAPGSHTDGQE